MIQAVYFDLNNSLVERCIGVDKLSRLFCLISSGEVGMIPVGSPTILALMVY